MSSEQQSEPNKRCIFYFKYQMKIEFIPHIQEEIQEFISLCESRVQYSQYREQIMVALRKRIEDIDHFFYSNWNDYRIQQVLRSRKFLVDFTKKYHHFLAIKKPQKKQAKQQDINETSPMAVIRHKTDSNEKLFPKSSLQRVKDSKQKYKNDHIRSDSKSPKHYLTHQKEKSSPKMQQFSPYRNQVPAKKVVIANFQASKEKERKLSSPSEQIKIKNKSAAVLNKMSPQTKKMTKEEYIAYLKNKKADS